jgi:hypothetical protein
LPPMEATITLPSATTAVATSSSRMARPCGELAVAERAQFPVQVRRLRLRRVPSALSRPSRPPHPRNIARSVLGGLDRHVGHHRKPSARPQKSRDGNGKTCQGQTLLVHTRTPYSHPADAPRHVSTQAVGQTSN